MELYESKNDYILVKNENAVFCDRITGKLTAQSAGDLCKAWNPVCIGQVVGLIGKIKYHPDSVWRLLLIRNSELVGVLPGGTSIFRVTRIAVLPLTAAEPVDLDIELCKRHHFGIKRIEKIMHSPDDQKPIMKAFHQIRTAAENVKPKKGLWQASNSDKGVRDREKFEIRVHEELVKIFEEDCSFYYSPDGDLTNTLQRQSQRKSDVQSSNNSTENDGSTRMAWLEADRRFFWNETLLSDILEQQPPAPEAAADFVLPLMQGFVQVEKLELDPPGVSLLTSLPKSPQVDETKRRETIQLTLALISRRSKHRAGTRFRRRGVDENGNVANFVETEQILEIHHEKGSHIVSFLQVRGSVPLFWSQSGIKYRPPPKLERADADNEAAFCKHFVDQLGNYGQLVLVSLVETVGQSESAIADAYLRRVMHFNSPAIKFVTFDFHEYCRKMHFENVSQLLEGLTETFRDMKYFWSFHSKRKDTSGIISEQKTVFRVNCIDCLDRTNVVQTAFARVVIEIQLRKLGLLYPDDSLPDSFQRTYQSMWANNGDTISRQYTSTPALKGDYTRTGERTLNGMMRDGVNSANRYFWRLKEFHRQLAIDVLLGNESSSPEVELIRQTSLSDNLNILKQKEDNMKQLIDRCRQLCLENDDYVGGWGLIASNEFGPPTSRPLMRFSVVITDTGVTKPSNLARKKRIRKSRRSDSSQQDMDTVLLVANRHYYVISGLCLLATNKDNIVSDDRFKAGVNAVCQRVLISSIDRIELGLEPTVFKSRAHYSMRVHFGQTPGCYHSFRQPQFRLFNNMLVPVKSEDEALESLRAIAESFNCAATLSNGSLVNIVEVRRLERKRSRPHPAEHTLDLPLDELQLTLPRQWQRVVNNLTDDADVALVARRASVQSQLRVKWGNMKEKMPVQLQLQKVRFSELRFKFMSSSTASQNKPSETETLPNATSDDQDDADMSDSEAELLMMLKQQEEDDEDEEEDEDDEDEAEEATEDTEVSGETKMMAHSSTATADKTPTSERTRKKKVAGEANLPEYINHSNTSSLTSDSAASDVLLSSCGIVATSQELWDSLPQAVDELAHSEDQFALAVVQDVAMRKAASREMRRHMERISLQLSFDDELSPRLFTTGTGVSIVPATPSSQPIAEEPEHFSFDQSVLDSISAAGLEVPNSDTALKLSLSETALSKQQQGLPVVLEEEVKSASESRRKSEATMLMDQKSPLRRTQLVQEENTNRSTSPLAALFTSAARLTSSSPLVSLEEEEQLVRTRAASLGIEIPKIRIANAPRTLMRLKRHQITLANKAIAMRLGEFNDDVQRTQIVIF